MRGSCQACIRIPRLQDRERASRITSFHGRVRSTLEPNEGIKITFADHVDALVTSAKGLCDLAEKADLSGDGWNPTTVLGHIVDVDNEVWMARFELMLRAHASSAPPVHFSWWEPDPVTTVERYSRYSLVQAQTALIESRRRMVAFLSGLTEADRQAQAIHKTFGEVTIESMLPVILNHDDEHGKSFSKQ